MFLLRCRCNGPTRTESEWILHECKEKQARMERGADGVHQESMCNALASAWQTPVRPDPLRRWSFVSGQQLENSSLLGFSVLLENQLTSSFFPLWYSSYVWLYLPHLSMCCAVSLFWLCSRVEVSRPWIVWRILLAAWLVDSQNLSSWKDPKQGFQLKALNLRMDLYRIHRVLLSSVMCSVLWKDAHAYPQRSNFRSIIQFLQEAEQFGRVGLGYDSAT